MKIEITKTGRCVPEWNENLSLPSDDQIYATWKRLSKIERKKYSRTKNQEIIIHNFGAKSDKEIDDALDQQSDLKMEIVSDNDGMLSAMNIKIFNLEDNEGPIATWKELNERQTDFYDGLIDELSSKILKKESPLTEQEAKN